MIDWNQLKQQGSQAVQNMNAMPYVLDPMRQDMSFTGLYNAKPPGKELEELYKRFLGRSPDEQGLNYWMGQLASGAVQPGPDLTRAFMYGAQNDPKFGNPAMGGGGGYGGLLGALLSGAGSGGGSAGGLLAQQPFDWSTMPGYGG